MLFQIDGPDAQLALRIEEDEKVAYAYLLHQGEIVGDVWLYNVVPNPSKVDWGNREDLPFCNPAQFCRSEAAVRVEGAHQVTCEWLRIGVIVYVQGRPYAKLMIGSKPGWSVNAAKAEPLALPLADDLFSE